VKPDLRGLIAPIAAFVLLAVTLLQTSDALRRAGAWRAQDRAASEPRPSPFEGLDREVARREALAPVRTERDPFDYRAAQQTRPTPAGAPRPRPAPPPPRPVLTAIIFDNDPRALVRFDGRDYTVRSNSLFAEYRVVRITRDEVVLDRGGESLVLRRPTGGS
jgi:hypothetical protein